MKKKKIILFIILILILSYLGYIILTKKSTSEKLTTYLINNKFQYNDDSTYFKQLSDTSLDEYYNLVNEKVNTTYEEIYFDINNFQLLKNRMDYYNGTSITFSPMYDYKYSKLEYVEEVSLNNSKAIFIGKYIDKTMKFTCELSNENNMSINKSNQEILCNNIKDDVISFDYYARKLITDKTLLKEIRK
jgi:hypothetical protein